MDQVLQGISTYRVRIRWRGDLTTEDQLRSDGVFRLRREGRQARPQHPLGRRSRRRRRELLIIGDTASTRT
jgi:hypothetical protein